MIKKNNPNIYIFNNYHPKEIIDCPVFDIPDVLPEYWEPILIEDNQVLIEKIENGEISWSVNVNEVFTTYIYSLYRIGERIGFITSKGLTPDFYSAVTIEEDNGNIYVAIVKIVESITSQIQKNPNYISHMGYLLEFYQLKDDGQMIKMEDSWKEFCPSDHKWFPKDFLRKNGIQKNENIFYDSSDSHLSYEKYGGYNGYDDDTIDEAFDGFPEATWNVD